MKTTLALALCLAPSLSAQISERPGLNTEGARQVLRGALVEARKLKTTGAIAVVDAGGHLLALERIDGTFTAAARVAEGKARTAATFQKPTKFFEEVIAKGRTSMVALEDFTPLQGGVPLVSGDAVVGAIGVSGAASAAQDEDLAQAGARALTQPVSESQVRIYSGMDVDSAFRKGAVLEDTGHFQVHASHRETDGQAEIHTLDTDIAHVLEGEATLITGGVAADVKEIGPNEFRGARIDHGQSRRVKKGDVIVIPNGIPHMFTDVAKPFNYYVVKVRAEQ